MAVIFNSWGTNIWPLYGIAGWPFFRGSVTVEVYVSSIRTRAFGRYIEGGCCTGVAVKRGSTVSTTIFFFTVFEEVGCRTIVLYQPELIIVYQISVEENLNIMTV